MKDVLLSCASGASSPRHRPEPGPGAPRSAAQFGDAVDVAPPKSLAVLLLSPTAAGPSRHAHGRRALTVAPTQPNAVSTTAGDCAGYRHTGRTLRTPLEARARGSATRRPATCRGRRSCAQTRQYHPSEVSSTGPAYPHGRTWLPLSQTCLPPREGARSQLSEGFPHGRHKLCAP